MTAIRRLLIANRGEIAVRIARTAAAMGIESVAVFAEDDEASLHVKRCGNAVPLSGRGVAAYLDARRLIGVARAEECDAIHPGYGLLSENADFARSCAEAGLTFTGPSADLLAKLGDKAEARRLAAQSGVPVVDGLNRSCSRSEVQDFFDRHGNGAPIMIKALAGGGGRGMRVVRERSEIEAAYRDCRREAEIAFGRGDLYVEQFVPRARHIEVQVLADSAGNVCHAWERECTLQRRNQKLVEIAPSPTIDAATRQAILDAAVRLASDIGYAGLGTFEFLLDADDPERYYFLEVNPRIQVEHTVTEQITGIDLVEIQLELAAGKTLDELGLAEPPKKSGYGLQLRVYLEDLRAGGAARPASGVVSVYEIPSGPGVRVDDCLYAGYRVNPNYDSLASKVIVAAGDYLAAVDKGRRALRELRLEGVLSNRNVLLNLLDRSEVRRNEVTTSFVESVLEELVAERVHGDLFFGGGVERESRRTEAPVPPGCYGVFAPVGGSLVVLAHRGDEVRAGQTIARIEAMKMEHSIEADQDGVVVEILTEEPGGFVDEGQLLAIVEPGAFADGQSPTSGEVDLDRVRPDLAKWRQRHERVLDAHRPEAVERRHAKGKRTARENLADLLDEGSFNEYGALALAAQRQKHSVEKLIEVSPADGLIAGTGSVNGRLFGAERSRCAVLAYDFTVMAGTQGFMSHKKTDRLLGLAKQWRLPLVLLAEGGGGRPSDTDYPAVAGLDLNTFAAMGELSGLVPTVAVVGGYCFAGNAALAGVCDAIIATRSSSLGMAGPSMIEAGGLGRFDAGEIGPPSVQAPNGVIDVLVEDEAEGVAVAKRYLSYFQGNVVEWQAPDPRRLRHAIPERRLQAYDVRRPIEALADEGSVLELRRRFAPNAVTALVRIEGQPFGLYANDPQHLGGAIDADAGDKIARFMQLCDAFDLPMVALCDTPGFMVGPESEKAAAVRHVSRIFLTAASLTVPVFTIVLRKSYGLGAMAMAAGGFHRPVLTAAWPSGEFGSMGLEGAVRLAARRELEAIPDEEERRRRFDELVEEMYEQGEAINAASYLEIDAVIDPAETRDWVMRGWAATPGPSAREGKKRPYVDAW